MANEQKYKVEGTTQVCLPGREWLTFQDGETVMLEPGERTDAIIEQAAKKGCTISLLNPPKAKSPAKSGKAKGKK